MSEQDLAVDDFKRWLGCNDVNTYGVAVENSATAPNSRGLFTSDTLSCANDDVLADVPSRLLISYSLVERISNEGKGAAASRMYACLRDMRRQHGHRFQTKPNRERIYIITFLVWLAYNDDQEASEEAAEFWTPSYWRPYFKILPNMGTYDTVLLWPTDTLALLAGTDLDTAACAKRDTLRREYDELHACLLKLSRQGDVSWERYLWADQVFWSRVLDLGTAFSCEGIASKGDDYHLVPLIDFCNHSFDNQIRWHVAATGTDDGWQIELRTTNAETRTIQPGTELFISYGDKPNAELFFVYNFAVQDNPYHSIRVRPPFLEDGMPDDDVKEDHEVETEVADSGLSPLSVQDKIAFMKALDLPSQLELRTLSRAEYADDLTKGLLSREALLIMYICVLTADDGFYRVKQQEQQGDVEGPKYTLQDRPIWPPTQETFKHFVESLPHFEVIQLRVWAVLLQVVTYRLGMLSEVQQHLEEPADDLQAARLSTIQTLRTSTFQLLVEALTLLQELQEQWAELEIVQQYLESMQLAD
ncbi:hypothetical protein HDU85_002594 [Gaertneriomyces sp. JEL0708]|nr:hypothetical protein HDU85_002594 [Gaertneriomyces sp. JEL0708]